MHCSQEHHARAHFDDIITAVTLIVDWPPQVNECHGLLHTHIWSSIAQHSSTPCSVGLPQPIICDDFILITFSFILFYLNSGTGCEALHKWVHTSLSHRQRPSHTGTEKHTHEKVCFCLIIYGKLSALMLNNTFKEVNQNLRISLQIHAGGIGEKNVFSWSQERNGWERVLARN